MLRYAMKKARQDRKRSDLAGIFSTLRFQLTRFRAFALFFQASTSTQTELVCQVKNGKKKRIPPKEFHFVLGR